MTPTPLFKALTFFLLLIPYYCVRAQAPDISYITPQTYTINTTITPLAPNNKGGAVPATIYGQTTTYAGTGGYGFSNGPATSATFQSVTRSFEDKNGNLFVVDRDNNAVRKISTTGVVSTLTSVGLNSPNGIVGDSNGNLFVTSAASNSIDMVTPAGITTRFAGNGGQGLVNGLGTAASFYYPYSITIDAAGNLYVADTYNNAIRKITPAGLVTTFAGGSQGSQDGIGTAASFSLTACINIDNSGNLYVADYYNNLIRKIAPDGTVTTIGGNKTAGFTNGLAATASFNAPDGVAIDIAGNIYVADFNNNAIRKIDTKGIVSTLAGNGSVGALDGVGSAATFYHPNDVQIDPSGFLYVTDYGNNKIRKVVVTGYTIDKTLPSGLTFDPTTGIITGTPTVTSPPTDYTITAYNAYGSSSTIVNIQVKDVSSVPAVAAPDISYQTPQTYTVNTTIAPLAPVNKGGAVPATLYGQTATYAGTGSYGFVDGQALSATFNSPARLFEDLSGNLFVTDRDNNAIRKISTSGVVSTITSSGLNGPNGVVADANGFLYVADAPSSSIEKITPTGVVTRLAGNGSQSLINGIGAAASFYYPYSITIDAAGNLYVADTFNNAIRKITPAGVVSTFAGGSQGASNGTGTSASFHYPNCVNFDRLGNLYVSDYGNNMIRKITPAGVVTTAVGNGTPGFTNGPVATASINTPGGVAVDVAGDVFIADFLNNAIRKLDTKGIVTTLAGNGSAGSVDGIGSAATFYHPNDVQADPAGFLFVTDYGNNKIRKITITGYTIDKPLPTGLSFDATTGIITGTPTVLSPATDYTITAYNAIGSSSTIVNIQVKDVSSIPAGTAPNISYQTPQTYKVNTTITALAPVNTGGIVPPNTYGMVSVFAGNGGWTNTDGKGTTASFNAPSGIATDPAGNIYVSDYGDGAIRKITPTAIVSTVANTGIPPGLVVDSKGNIFTSDFQGNIIYKITPTGTKTIFAGSGTSGSLDGVGTAATFNTPSGMTIDAADNIYVAEQQNNKVRKITPTAMVSTLAGTGSTGSNNGPALSTTFNNPDGLTIDNLGNIYVADTKNNLIRKITPGRIVSTFAGNGVAGRIDGTGAAASFNYPTSITSDPLGNLYVADYKNTEIREITPAGVVTTLAGSSLTGTTDGIGKNARFTSPLSLAFDVLGDLYITEFLTNYIRKITLTGYSIDKQLPAGLVFDQTTGTITGIPSIISPLTDYTITAFNLYGSSSATVNITVVDAEALVFGPIPQKTICDIDFGPGATSNSGNITYTSSNTNVATIIGNKIHIISAGTTTITANDGKATLNQVLTVIAPTTPVVSIAPDLTQVCEGTPVTFTATITGSQTNNSYQWFLNGNKAGSNLPTFTSSTLTPADVIKCLVTNTDSCPSVGTSNSYTGLSVSPNVAASVSITALPTGTVNSGTPVTFLAVPGFYGTNPTYQWQLNGVNVGDGSSVYTNSCLENGDKVNVTLSNTGGLCLFPLTAVSNTIVASISQSANSPVVVVTASANNVPAGTPITFTANVNNTSALSYQWNLNGTNTGTNSNTFTSNTLNNNDVVTCTVTTVAACTPVITSAPLTVNILPAIILTFAPIPQKTICDIDFDPGATSNGGAITYTSSNANVATIIGNKVHITGGGTTTITANDGVNAAKQVVTVIAPSAPVVSIAPDLTQICEGTPVTFTATITGSLTNNSYQWLLNGNKVGSNQPTYTSSTLTAADVVKCMVTNTDSCPVTGTSNPYTGLIVNPKVATSVTIIAQPSGTVTSGTTITFFATPGFYGTNPTYQWRLNGINVGNGGSTYSNSCLADGDKVTVTLSNTGGLCLFPLSATSNAIYASISQPLQSPSVAITASASSVYFGVNVVFTAIVTGTTPISYQWQVNGANVGTNSATYANNSLNNGDNITCLVSTTNICMPTLTGLPFVITVLPPATIKIPNTFTPNGDGTNDVWSIPALAFFPNCKVSIYNRYGPLIYQSKGYIKPWDGTINNALVPVGTYYYIIDFGDIKKQSLSGSITVIR